MTPPAGLDMDGLVLLGSTQCPPCAQVSAWLDARGIVHRKFAIDAGGTLDEDLCRFIVATTGQQRVPQLYWRGQWLPRGIEDVAQMVASGEILSRGP